MLSEKAKPEAAFLPDLPVNASHNHAGGKQGVRHAAPPFSRRAIAGFMAHAEPDSHIAPVVGRWFFLHGPLRQRQVRTPVNPALSNWRASAGSGYSLSYGSQAQPQPQQAQEEGA